jgi:hypothetical protein
MDYLYVENNFQTKPITDKGVAELVDVGFIAKSTKVVKITIKTNEYYSDAQRKADLTVESSDVNLDMVLKFEGSFFAQNGPFLKGLKDQKGYGRGPFYDKHPCVPPIDSCPPGADVQKPFVLKKFDGKHDAPVNGNGYCVRGILTGYKIEELGEIVTGRLVLYIEV